MFKGQCIYTITYIKYIETCQNMFASTVNVNKYPIYAKAFLNLLTPTAAQKKKKLLVEVNK